MSHPQPSSLVLRYTFIVIVIAAVAGAFAWVAGWIHWPGSESALTPARMIDAFEDSMGRHAGFRRNHAKGVCVSGYFDSNGSGVALSHARVFERGRTPVIGRLSAPGGNPAQDDADTTVRSFALLFSLHNGEQWRTAMNSVPIFQVATPQALYEQLVALRPDARTGRRDPAKMSSFFAKHPETTAFREWIETHPPSSAFYNAIYFSIDAFRFVDANGNTRFVRWRVVPDTPYAPSNEHTNPARDPDFLAHDLDLRLQTGPVSWHLMLTPAGPGDPVDDATRAWPAERDLHRVDAGMIVIERAESQIDGACRDINFDPLILPDGIAPSDDPLLAARSAVYEISFERRTREETAAGTRPR
ncbi:catalase [Paraburkholderia sp. BL23I1N1]|uniref:catalase family peroxidase n=1 Tax=Paraburkholderia sp. BL23I1N1 TaxID=1938802 RepID=UPI000E70E26F|nr:catalase family peroxidase [Paraburkholderia sp. BL23I1N1]RKE36296.1 catalase [Paraburkholderia sp. BL23I1N1]